MVEHKADTACLTEVSSEQLEEARTDLARIGWGALVLAAALFLGLPFTTERIVNERVDQTFTVMATPTPSVDDYIQ